MKRFITKLSVLAVLAFSIHAFADDQSSGCGMGWMLFKRNSLLSSYLRNITNATFSNTIAMTSGTSGCAKHDLVQNEKREIHYAESNFNSLNVEMALGRGESVTQLAYVMGCDSSVVGTFLSETQKNYGTIFESDSTTPSQMLNQVHQIVNANPTLSQGCAVTL